MIDVLPKTLIDTIPVIFVLLLIISQIAYHLKYRKALKDNLPHLFFSVVFCLMAILTLYLHSQSFVAPMIMAMMLTGLFWFLSLLPVFCGENELRVSPSVR